MTMYDEIKDWYTSVFSSENDDLPFVDAETALESSGDDLDVLVSYDFVCLDTFLTSFPQEELMDIFFTSSSCALQRLQTGFRLGIYNGFL